MAHTVFVFGTLKQGFPNFATNSGRRIDGVFVTQQRYPLYLVGERHSPWMVNLPGQGVQVAGQLFEVDDAALAAMDQLERVHEPDGYVRVAIEVHSADGHARTAQAYLKRGEHLEPAQIRVGPLNEYTPAHAALYRSRANPVATPQLQIRPAAEADITAVARLLSTAATGLIERGEALWDLKDVSEAAIGPHVLAGWYFIASDGQGPVGVFRLQGEDPLFWPDVTDGRSVFLHKLAVHPRAQGRSIAQQLLTHALALARERGKQYLRLDCVQGRPKLSSVYQRFGFRLHSVRQLGQRLYERYEISV